MKKRWIGICIICLCFVTAGAVLLRFRGSHTVSAREDVVPEPEVVLYRQDDEKWSGQFSLYADCQSRKRGVLLYGFVGR